MNRPPYDLGRPLQRRDGHVAVLGVEQPADLAAAGVHALGQPLAREVLRLHRRGDLPCQHLLDGDGLERFALFLLSSGRHPACDARLITACTGVPSVDSIAATVRRSRFGTSRSANPPMKPSIAATSQGIASLTLTILLIISARIVFANKSNPIAAMTPQADADRAHPIVHTGLITRLKLEGFQARRDGEYGASSAEHAPNHIGSPLHRVCIDKRCPPKKG